MDKKTIETIMTNLGIKADADGILALVEDHPTYKKMNEEHGPDETIQAIAEDYPKLFETVNTIPLYGSEQDQDQKPRKRSRYNPGKIKHNNGAGVHLSGRERGRKRAQDRHRKKGI